MMANFPEYEASEAEAKFEELLERVERGETVCIARSGKIVARIVPDEDARRAEAAETIKRLKALREKVGKAPREEILASRHEGHKY